MVLILEDIAEGIDFQIIALRSNLPDYKLAYKLNQRLKIQLTRKKNDLDLMINKEIFFFAAYEFLVEEQKMIYLLKNNVSKSFIEKKAALFDNERGEKKFFLIPELFYFDFFLKVRGYNVDELTQKLKKIKNIEITRNIELFTLKSINHFIF